MMRALWGGNPSLALTGRTTLHMHEQHRKEQEPLDNTRVICNQQMITVFVEHNKVIAKVLKKYYQLTPTEFCILRALYLSDGRVEGIDFASFLYLKRNSISMALSKLEDRELIGKAASQQDRRSIVVTETKRGTEVTRQATADIYGALTNSFWHDLDLADKRGGNETASLVLEALRGTPTKAPGKLKESNTPISPEFIVFCKVVPQLWSARLVPLGLSLSEYRMLNAVWQADEPIRSTDIARSLLLERSVVSLFKDTMVEKGLVSFSPAEGDRRNYEVSLTPEGEGLVLCAQTSLQEETDRAYALCDDTLVSHINEWHLRMFRNMNVLNAVV